LAGKSKNRCPIRQGGAFALAGDFALHFNEVLLVALSLGPGPAQNAVQPTTWELSDNKGIADSV
jgi:hypothetical protein